MPKSAPITEALVAEVVARVSQDMRVRRFLADGGRIHLDRRLPFLCVYRRPDGGDDAGTDHLVSAETSVLHLPGDARSVFGSRLLVKSLVKALSEHFGGFLIVEIWSERPEDPSHVPTAETGEPLPPQPAFTVFAPKRRRPEDTVQTLLKSLGKIRLLRQRAVANLDEEAGPRPPGMKPLLLASDAARLDCYSLGIQVRPVYRDHATHEIFPSVLRVLRRRFGYALKRTFFAFAEEHTKVRPEHYYSLGRRSVLKVVWEIDRRLAEIDNSFDLLLQATPVNAEGAWREFRRRRFQADPVFHYRPLAVEPSLLKRSLYDVPAERIEDPTLAHLFLEKQDELGRRITMLSDIGTPHFLAGSLQVYGRVTPELLDAARQLLQSARKRNSRRRQVDARTFAAKAQEEIDFYRRRYEGFTATVTVRKDIYSGLLVSRGHLLVGQGTKIPAARVDALLQHEVGTHLVTFYNGQSQPLRQLECGLAGFDEVQEGLAVLAEYLVGGLDGPRLRTLAARVIAAQSLLDGASFVDTYRALTREYGFPQRQAYTIAMRVYRAGGLTKDLVYLQGLITILGYMRNGGEIEPLTVGKLGADHVPIVRELTFRRVLHCPPLRPRYFERPGVADALARLRNGITISQLVKVSLK